jgi:hypothetical protein
MRPLRPELPSAGPPPPEPGFLDTIAAGFHAARGDTSGYDAQQRDDAYSALVDGLADLGYPVTRFVQPSRAGSGMDYARIYQTVLAEKKNGHFKDVPDTIEQFDQRWKDRTRGYLDQQGAIAARGNPVARFIGGVSAGFTDPINILTLPVGGFGKTVAARVGTEVLSQMAIEAATIPGIQAQRRELGRPELTGGEVATDIGLAGATGGLFRGGAEIAPHGGAAFRRTIDANLDKLPKDLRDRYIASRLAKADPLDDPVMLADLTEALIGRDNLAEHEAATVDVTRREGAIAAANPFARNGIGAEVHDGLIADTLAQVQAAHPALPTRDLPTAPRGTGGEPAASGPAAPVSVTGAEAGFMARVRRAESSGSDSARNPRSSAEGRYQFTDRTWLSYYKRRFGSGGLSDAAILAKKIDGRLQDLLMQDLTDDNAAFLRARGEAVTEGNLYLTHFAGQGGARRIFDADPAASLESVLGRDVIAANPFLRGHDAAWLIRWAHEKMGGAVPPRAGARLTVDGDALGGLEAEGQRIQQALDDAVGRADALAEAARAQRAGELTVPQYVDAYIAGRWREDGAPPEVEQFAVNNADAIEAEFQRRAEAPPPPLAAPELHERDAELPEQSLGPEHAPSAASAEVQALLPQIRAIVSDRARSINRIDEIAQELGATADEVRRGLTELALRGEIRMKMSAEERGRVPLSAKGGRRRKDAEGVVRHGDRRFRNRTDAEVVGDRGGVWDGQFMRRPPAPAKGERTLLERIADLGGIEDTGGELAHMGADRWHLEAPFRRKLIRPAPPADERGMFGGARQSANSAESVFETLVSEGYFPELLHTTDPTAALRYGDLPDIEVLRDAMRRELGGNPVRSVHYAPRAPEGDEFLRSLADDEAEAAARDAFWARYDRISDAAEARYKAVLLTKDTGEIEDLMREGTAWMDPVEPHAGMSDDEIAPWIGEWLNRKVDDLLDAARAEAEDDFYDWSGEFSFGQADAARGGGERPAPDAGDARGGEVAPGASARADARAGGGGGAPLADLDPAQRAPFLDPDGGAAKAQADSLEHDLRADLARTEGTATGVRRGDMIEVRGYPARTIARAYDLPLTMRDGEAMVEVPASEAARLSDAGVRIDDSRDNPTALDSGAAVDPNIAARERQENALRAAAPLSGRVKGGEEARGAAQDATMPEGLFGGEVEPRFRLDAEGPEQSLADIVGDLDAEAADLKTIRDCL